MIIFYVLLFICAAVFLLKLFEKSEDKFFIGITSVTTFYYGVLGPWYWLSYQNGSFIGVDWSSKFPLVIFSFAFAQLLVIFYLFCFRFFEKKYFVVSHNFTEFYVYASPVRSGVFILGAVSSLYVMLSGAGSELNADGLLLICYQFSDIMIALILYYYVVGSKLKKSVLIFLYACFCIYVGLRYKLALLFGAIALYEFTISSSRPFAKKLIMMTLVSVVVLFFGVMTISRNKFSGLDLSALNGIYVEDFLYGIFAESNIIFGVASVLSNFGITEEYVHFQPVIDSFTQFIPRHFYPDKSLYQHLVTVQYGLGASEEALSTGTAIPYFAEYYTMFGMTGFLLGVMLYVFIYLKLSSLIKNFCLEVKLNHMGHCLLLVTWGYYYYSRGSMAQIFKAVIFVFLVYLIVSIDKKKDVDL